jgi:hypothetical protein
MILPRLLSIALRKYTAEPESRDSAVRMLLTNAVRLCAFHLGDKEAARVALNALTEKTERAA